MHPAEALDADYLPGPYSGARKLYGVARYLAPGSVEIKAARPALRAAVRLRVIPPVSYIVELPLAVRAHREARHGRARPVVGHGFYYRKARPAVRAVYKWIPKPPVRRVEKLPPAVAADSHVRRDQRLHALSRLAGKYFKALVLPRRALLILHGLDARERRASIF